VGKPEGKSHLEDIGVDGDNIKRVFKVGWEARTGFIWLWIGTGGGHLWIQQ